MAVFNLTDQYRYKGKGPFDAKSLVKTYDELLQVSSWTVDGTFIAYNGMIVAVWLNKADTTKNGIYYLYDPAVANTINKPAVANEANWHKLADASAVAELVASINNNTQAIARIYSVNDDGSVAGLLAQEISRATAAEQANADRIAILVGNDTNKTIRVIAKEEIAKLIDTGDQTVSAYVSDQIAKLVMPKASDEITIAEDGTLGIGEVSTDKLAQGDKTLVLSGGSAR